MPRSVWVASLVALLASLGVAGGAGAQAPRSGLWLEGARGTGTVRNTCAGCTGVSVGYGSAYHVRAGGALNPRVLVGLEIFSLHSRDLVLEGGAGPVEAKNTSISPIVIWYVGSSGFFLKGGAGLARGIFSVESPSGGLVETDRIGSGLTFGVGFDVGLLSWLALSADLSTYVTAVGDVDVAGGVVDDLIATVYNIGLGLTIR